MVCADDIAVIAHRDSKFGDLTLQEVAYTYLGKTINLHGSGETPVKLYDLQDGVLRERFFRILTNADLNQVNAYWARLQFSGTVLPPIRLSDSQAVLNAVSHNPNTIGYIDATLVNPSVKVLLFLRE